MKAELDVQLKTVDMYRYNMYYAYTSFSGYFALIMAGVAFVMACRAWDRTGPVYTALYSALGALFILYIPGTLYLRSRQQVLSSPVLSRSLHYVIDDAGVTTSQGEASSTLAWEQVYRFVVTKHNILVCMNPRNAFIIPRDQAAGQYGAITQLAQAHLEAYRLKLK